MMSLTCLATAGIAAVLILLELTHGKTDHVIVHTAVFALSLYLYRVVQR